MANSLVKMTIAQYLLLFTCKDTYGINASVTAFLTENRAFIRELAEFGDASTGKFFLRCLFEFPDSKPNLSHLAEKFSHIGDKFNAKWQFVDLCYKPKTLILVSKFGHCLSDLLHRYQSSRLNLDIAGIISNHNDMRQMVEWYQLPFLHLPVSNANKAEQEDKLLSLIEKQQIDLIILARYMQILSPLITRKLPGKIINIHHSFLPSFKGARPYHQAFERGVKIIGATAHYVTEDLDEGPIIEQEVLRVDHTRSPEELVSLGFDIETQVLARAVKFHIENRIFINGNKTVIFK